MTNPKMLCLNMIVRNEIVNLERCLGAVADHIDCWVICDTGSTDGTQRDFFASRGIPGELHEFPFINFAQARNEALTRARNSSLPFNYLLLTDADMELRVNEPAFANQLREDAYHVLQRAGISYWNIRLVRREADAYYKGVTHEFLEVRGGSTAQLAEIEFIDHASGSNRVEKFDRDVRLLRAALAEEIDAGMVSRYTFYLANTLRDGGRKEEALQEYLERADLGGWQEEVFMSLFYASQIKEELQYREEDVIAAYRRASDCLPSRAEALHAAARFCRNLKRYAEAYQFAREGLQIAYPKSGLFVFDWIYDHGLLDELSIAAYWTGRFAESKKLCESLLSNEKLSAGDRERIVGNLRFAEERVGELRLPEGEVPWDAALRVAVRAEELGCPAEDVAAAYERAFELHQEDSASLLRAARFCRKAGLNTTGAYFAELGLAQTDREGDLDSRLTTELIEELSITANYSDNPLRHALGHSACEWLALSRVVPEGMRELAHRNLAFYAKGAQQLFPSFRPTRINFGAPVGYNCLNPSVARFRDRLVLIQRTANYTVTPDGARYDIHKGSSVHTRNFLLTLNDEFDVTSSSEILPPHDMPEPIFPAVLGFEDMRLTEWQGTLWTSSTVRESNPQGLCEQFLARIEPADIGAARLADWRFMQPEHQPTHEKNWMPWRRSDELQFLAICDPSQVRDSYGKLISESQPTASLVHFRGGSQVIPFGDGWLAVVHEVSIAGSARTYLHRFIKLDRAGTILGISQRHFLLRKGIEFVAGLAWHPNGEQLLVSFGVGDAESWLATISSSDIEASLHRLDADWRTVLRPLTPISLCKPSTSEEKSINEFVTSQTNKALRNSMQVDFAATSLLRAGLPMHPDRPKAWDTLLALSLALGLVDPRSAVLDAGAGLESAFLPSLAMSGFDSLWGINLLFNKPVRIGSITYEYGDITGTVYPRSQFSFVACLSVIEHGVDIRMFLLEMARIIRPGGFLFVSTDYWPDAVDTSGVTMFGAPFTIFDRTDLVRLIEQASECGFRLYGGEENFDADEQVIDNMGVKYTFANSFFQRI
jgi:SAM-dependent methyltransferase/glycosyltransferase involved in cell wall biosynthesis